MREGGFGEPPVAVVERIERARQDRAAHGRIGLGASGGHMGRVHVARSQGAHGVAVVIAL